VPRLHKRAFAQGIHQKKIIGFHYGAENWIIPNPTFADRVSYHTLQEVCAAKFPGEDVVLHFAMFVGTRNLNGLTLHAVWDLPALQHNLDKCGPLTPAEMQAYLPGLPHYFILNQARNRGSNQWRLRRVIFERKEKAKYNPLAFTR
jgi:hypothetical protein